MNSTEDTLYRIVVDTREKKPYNFYGREVIREALYTGDYSIEGFEDQFAIERKSLSDYIRSISYDRKRFEDEVERGSSFDKFEVVIESDLETVRNGDYYADVAPLSAINTAKSWKNRYGVEFLWAGSRKAAKSYTLNQIDNYIEEQINN